MRYVVRFAEVRFLKKENAVKTFSNTIGIQKGELVGAINVMKACPEAVIRGEDPSRDKQMFDLEKWRRISIPYHLQL